MRLFDRFPPRYLAPNLITLTSLTLGLASIYASLTATTRAGLERAAWFVLYTVLLDKADGAVARRLRASSAIGVQLDSFSDFVTFGIAPAALLTALVPLAVPQPFAQGPARALCMGVGAVYVAATAVRLARFNVTTGSNDPRFFLGLPSTASGGLLANTVLAHAELGLPARVLVALLGAMVLNSALMLCNLRMPKLAPPRHPVARYTMLAVVGSTFVLIPLHRAPTYLLAVASSLVIGGFLYGLVAARPPATARLPTPQIDQKAERGGASSRPGR